MSVPDQVPKTELVASGASITQFDYTFYAPVTSNIHVLVNGSAVSSGWTVSSNEGGSGFVKFDSPVVTGATVTIYRSTPMTQPVDLEQGNTFYPQVVTDCMDNVVMGMQEMRGGVVNIPGGGVASATYANSAGSANSAGYATSAGYALSAGIAQELASNFVANSAYHATTAAGLDAGVIVSSAAHAVNADSATVANGAEYATSAGAASSAGVAVASGGTANYASSAGSAASAGNAGYATNAGFATNAGHAGDADIASSLTSGAKDDILLSAGGKYEGPWNAYFTGEDEVYIAGGHVFAGGKMYAYQGGGCDAESGDTIYLVLSSSSNGTTPIDSYTTNPPSTADNPRTDLLITRIAKNEGGVLKQYQFGDIACVPWGATAGGAASAYVRTVADGFEAPSPGIIMANAAINDSEAAGNAAIIAIGGVPHTYAQVPQGGVATDFGSATVGCSFIQPVDSGDTVRVYGSMRQTVYFLGFGSDPNN